MHIVIRLDEEDIDVEKIGNAYNIEVPGGAVAISFSEEAVKAFIAGVGGIALLGDKRPAVCRCGHGMEAHAVSTQGRAHMFCKHSNCDCQDFTMD